MVAREAIKIVEADGRYLDRQKGSHKIYKHPNKKGIVVIPDHGKQEIPAGTLNSILKQAGLK